MNRNNNQDNSWIGPMFIWYLVFVALFTVFMCGITSCSPKIITHTETVIEYRDRVVHDTTTFEIEKEVEKIVTKDTTSHLENKYAQSDAMVSGGFLHHSLESKPQIIEIPVEVHVTDTLWKESEVITKIKEVEKELNWWQKMKQSTWGWMLFALAGALIYIFRKQILALIKIFI